MSHISVHFMFFDSVIVAYEVDFEQNFGRRKSASRLACCSLANSPHPVPSSLYQMWQPTHQRLVY